MIGKNGKDGGDQMSADEISSLARQAFEDGTPSPSHRAGIIYIEDRCRQYATALLAFSKMVERCEKIKSRYCLARNRIDKITTYHPDASYEELLSKIQEFDYILKGTNADN